MPPRPIFETFALPEPFEPTVAWRRLRWSPSDPTSFVQRHDGNAEAVKTMRMADGPATVRVRIVGGRAEAWAAGPGAAAAIDLVRGWLGADDDPTSFTPSHPLLRRLIRALHGYRMIAIGQVWEGLVPTVLAQKVTGEEAGQAFRALVRVYGEPAPPLDGVPPWLRVVPAPERVAALPSYDWHRLGVERRRAETIRRVARRIARIEAAALDGPTALARVLESFAGVGPWTSGELRLRALGDPDAVPVGDFHIPNTVAWALAREPRADDDRMLELLAPFAGHRGRVIRLLELGGIRAPAYGPRMPRRRIAAH